ncbi:ATP-binding protein [Acrocarpospora catenulata]|uniref:ATP-binding protein n=1 Tax=Acrocarpospora catenulata TaxID=2836182 RepID=UPI001BD9B6A4|nr:AAA family ATPase [Acrocarpospora catenulata]
MPVFIGRAEPLGRLTAAYQAVTATPGGAIPGWAGLVLVTGEAGIGKTALLTEFTNQVVAAGGTVVWGTCWDGDQAPAWWPWTQALRALIEQRPDLTAPELGAILPELPGTDGTVSRVRIFDAAGRLLRRAAPVVVILDDLQWADESTVDLLRFLAGAPQRGAVLLVGAYRPHEPPPGVTAALAELAGGAELVTLRGLSAGEVADLAQTVTGTAAPDEWVRIVRERSGGHPFYARELCRLLATGGTAADVPVAVRDVIGRRLARLSPECAALLDAAAVAGMTLLPDVLAEVTGEDGTRIAVLVAEAAGAGILAPAGRFAHDLYRETIVTTLEPARRLDLHHRIALALLDRYDRGGPVFEAELAHHFTAALPVADTASAVAWTHAAARADTARFAFAEAAGHVTRLRAAVAAAGLRLSDTDLVGLLTTEADLRLRAGDAVRARELLDTAWARAAVTGRADLLGAVALGLDRVDARFAMPRADLLSVLATAREALDGTGTTTEATVTAALARQLQHSVPADRPQARPLAERAVTIARTLDDPATLASCLLAQHDTLWTPGTAVTRAAIAAEITGLARRAGDRERHAQALLLSATAQLENASAAFRATFTEYAHVTRRLRQPRHDYLLRTREAAIALLDGDIATGERLSAEAAALGESVGDSDTGNVRMSQRLEVVRARNRPAELREMADEAVAWWIGAPAHAHAVAAGFRARAGDLDAARRELDTVLALEDWRSDRSYLWSIFIGEMVTAAIAVRDLPLCRQLLGDLLPLAETCAVNAALVCFMGAHAHRVGLLYAALDEPEPARHWLHHALQTHRRLGARTWEAETDQALTALDTGAAETSQSLTDLRESVAPNPDIPLLHRVGDMWQATYRGHTAYLRDTKGLRDLATLLAHPDTDLPALDLAATDHSTAAPASAGRTTVTRPDPVLDRTALAAYRRRLAELDDEITTAKTLGDLARHQRATDEREQVLSELRRATRPDGASRPLGPTPAERARKAVTARIRDAIRRISDAHPELGTHLNRSIRTGTTCRYEAGQQS